MGEAYDTEALVSQPMLLVGFILPVTTLLLLGIFWGGFRSFVCWFYLFCHWFHCDAHWPVRNDAGWMGLGAG